MKNRNALYCTNIRKAQEMFDDMIALGFNAIIEKIGELFAVIITEKEQNHAN